jgi:hypothetical protein
MHRDLADSLNVRGMSLAAVGEINSARTRAVVQKEEPALALTALIAALEGKDACRLGRNTFVASLRRSVIVKMELNVALPLKLVLPNMDAA